MEDLSNFITEEIFILKDETVTLEPVKTTGSATSKLAVISGDISEEESILLGNILSALKLNEGDISHIGKIIEEVSDKWLIFAQSYEVKSIELDFYKPTRIGNGTYVLAQPLSVLRESKEEKQNLWSSLKELFDI
ncbi:MAG: hypothetical protein GY816_14850 [Cytophagales bacterium]|nr:hypothetical protein [Cytophagales bacterium]